MEKRNNDQLHSSPLPHRQGQGGGSMDIPLPPRPWYVKYRMYILGGAVLVALVVYALILQLGPRTSHKYAGERYRKLYGGTYLLP